MVKKALPVGRDSFNEIRNDGYYYVDKTDWYGICSSQVVWWWEVFEDMFTGYLQDTQKIFENH